MQEIIDLTKELIRFKSMHSQPQEIERCAAFIEDYLKDANLTYRRLDRNRIPSLLVTRPDGYVPILLMSHIDVVDAADPLFEPRQQDGKLYGRGSLDDKYAVALSLVLLKEHISQLKQADKTQSDLVCGILITGDEEIGGVNGAQAALQELKADFCIALDGGGLEKIVVKEKGILQLKLVARGKAAHGARPWLGANAIEKLIDDYQKIKKMFDRSTPDHWHRTMNFSCFQAGKSVNQVPDLAEARFDIRYTEHDQIDDLVAQMRRAIQSELMVEKKEPLFVGGESPYLDLLLSIARDTELGFEHGASDARFLSNFGIKGIVWGADGDSSAHSEDEHVNIESIARLYTLLDRFVATSTFDRH
jgi:succinyl-diaminopimelate desuccinylase